ncbi:hypothetical protein CKK34_5222 [Yarrowia sp. E02]|nr:hypothetical protein CKK34_5222 [Yarrowia sp. E02]
MSPSGDLLSWKDCALVFVKRLASEKWTKTGLGQFRTGDHITTVKEVIAKPLPWGQKLPSEFRGLDARKNGHADYSETRELQKVKGHDEYIDLKTYQRVLFAEHILDPPEVSENEQVVKYNSLEITLPSGVKLDDKKGMPITVNRYTVVVECVREENGGGEVNERENSSPSYFSYLLPINNLHYKYGTVIESPTRVYEIGTIVVSESPSKKLWDIQYHKYQLYYYDVDAQKYVSYAVSSSVPVASYNGLVWWKEKDRLEVTPTFVDMDEEGKGQVYFHKDRSVCIDTELVDSCRHIDTLDQCSREPQFIFAANEDGLLLIDLSTGSATSLIEDNMGHSWTTVFPGYVGDTFYVGCWTGETIKRHVKPPWLGMKQAEPWE